MSLRKIVRTIHLWLGLLSGLVVFLLGTTGAIYAFEGQIRPLIYKSRHEINPGPGKPLSLESLQVIAQGALPDIACKVNRIYIPASRNMAYQFGAYAFDPGAFTYFGQVLCRYNVTVNPYDGNVVYVEDSKYEFFTLVEFFHYNLFLGEVGRQITGWGTAIFVLMLFSGIFLWFPKNKAAAKQRFIFRWKATTRWKRQNYDLHSILGFYVCIIALVIALTGLMWVFKWFNHSARFIANAGQTTETAPALFSDTTSNRHPVSLDQVLAVARENMPGADSYFIDKPAGKAGTCYVSIRYPGEEYYKSNTLTIDQYSGSVLKTDSFARKNNGDKLYAINYDIHRGTVFGVAGIAIAFLVSLISASLPVTGFLIWRGRMKSS